MITAISAFPKLRVLSLLPPRERNTDSMFFAIRTPADKKKTASKLFRALPALERITFPPRPEIEGREWFARSKDMADSGDTVLDWEKIQR